MRLDAAAKPKDTRLVVIIRKRTPNAIGQSGKGRGASFIDLRLAMVGLTRDGKLGESVATSALMQSHISRIITWALELRQPKRFKPGHRLCMTRSTKSTSTL